MDEAFEGFARGPGVYGLFGAADAFVDGLRVAGDVDGGAGVQEDHVARRAPLLAGEHVAHYAGVEVGIAAEQAVGGVDNPFYIMAVGMAVGAGGSLPWGAARHGR